MRLATYLGLAHHAEGVLAESFRVIGRGHARHPDVLFTCLTLATMSEEHLRRLAPMADRYGEQRDGADVDEPERLHTDGLAEVRTGPLALLRDLQDLYTLAAFVQTTWTVVLQAAQGLRDHDLIALAQHAGTESGRQLAWLTTRIKVAAPQALLVTATPSG
jgi:hypothetical protein